MSFEEEINGFNFYVVINSDGQFFRRKGYGGYGSTWVNNMKSARVYANISGARSIVTFFSKNYPQYPPPRIIKLGVNVLEIMDETERVKKAEENRQKRLQEKMIREAKRKLKQAEDNLARLKKPFQAM